MGRHSAAGRLIIMYYNYLSTFGIGTYDSELTHSGIWSRPGPVSILEEDFNDNWNIVITVSGIYSNQFGSLDYSTFQTLYADIQDVYIIGEHKINSLQDGVRHTEPWGPWGPKTIISKWSRATFSGAVVGETWDNHPSAEHPFVLFSGMVRHFVADDGFWFGSTCVRFDKMGYPNAPYVAFADYPATGEESWFEIGDIQGAVDMEYVESFDGGRMLVSTTISGLLILDTETTFTSPYPQSDLSALSLAPGVFVTDLDTLRTY